VERITHNTSDRLRIMCYVLCDYVFNSRFFIEFLRIDPTAGNIGGMRATMGLSLLIFALSAGYLIYLRQNGNIIKAFKN